MNSSLVYEHKLHLNCSSWNKTYQFMIYRIVVWFDLMHFKF